MYVYVHVRDETRRDEMGWDEATEARQCSLYAYLLARLLLARLYSVAPVLTYLPVLRDLSVEAYIL